jgi:D-alanyl-D-alanine carboxypeptidase
LVDEGKLTLDTPISDFGIDLPGSETATIAQILGMTSGIFSYTEDEKFAVDYYADPAMAFRPEDALAIARKHGPDFAPGEGIHYSDTGYIVAGMIAEQVTGTPIEQLIHDRFIAPYALSRTSFPTDPAMPDPHLDGYQPVEGSDEPMDVTESNPNAAWAAGAMISTLADMKTWLELLTDGSLLSPELQEARMQTIPMAPGRPLGYGLGIMELFGFYGHNGGIAGYSTFMLRDPNDGATIITVANLSDERGGGADSIAIQLLDYLLPDRFALNAPGVGTPAASPVSS